MLRPEPAGTPPGLGAIAGGLAQDVGDLVRGEIALARLELDRKLHELVIATVSILGGALVAFAGLVVLLEGGAAVLAFWLPAWASLSIVGVAILLVGGIVARIGLFALSLKTLMPDRTIASVQKDAQMMKDRR